MSRLFLDDQYVAVAHPASRERTMLKGLPGAFDYDDGLRFPASPASVDAIFKALGRDLSHCDIDTRLALIASDPFRPRNIYATDLDDIPVTFTKPWRHQVQAFWFAHDRKGVLMDVGLGAGKTKIASDIALNTNAKRMLVLAPKSVVENWTPELIKHYTPGAKVVAVDVGFNVAQRAQQIATALQTTPPDVPLWIICNHTAATLDAVQDVIIGKKLSGPKAKITRYAAHRRWDLVVIDEAQKICDCRTNLAKAAYALGDYAEKRLALTGTPIRKTPLSVYGIARFCDKKVFGPLYTDFRDRYGVVDPETLKVVGMNPDTEKEFEEKMGTFTFHVDRSVLDLPPAQHIIHHVTLCKEAQSIHDRVYAGLEAIILDDKVSPANKGVGLLRAQQVTSGYAKRDGDAVEQVIDTAKRDALTDIFDSLPDDEPIIVFARFTHDIATIHEACLATGRSLAILDGKHNDLKRWQAGHFNVIAVQIQAGGLGIDLTRAAYSVYFSVGYIAPDDYDQSLARPHRPGQTRNVQYHHLIASHSIDVEVYAAMQARQNIIDHLRDITRARVAALAS